MMKKYEEPKIEIIQFTVEDILTSSSTSPTDTPDTLTLSGVNIGNVNADSSNLLLD